MAHWLTEGRLAVSEALRVSMAIAEALRQIHDEGRAHGAVCPANVEIAECGVVLATGPAEIAYQAPEILAGQAPDARSDIFSFGAIVFEMFTGRRAFEDESRREVQSTGSPAVDRLVLPCLALQRESRPRMGRVIADLNMLKLAARRAAAVTAARDREARLAARLDAQEHVMAGVQLSVEEALRAHTAAIHSARLQIAQTEEVLERLVKSMEALQRAMSHKDESGDSAIAGN
jgi:hypothetical protein